MKHDHDHQEAGTEHGIDRDHRNTPSIPHLGHNAPRLHAHDKSAHNGSHAGAHTGHSVEMFRKRFWISVIATVPILLLTPQIQNALGLTGMVDSLGRGFQDFQNLLLFVLSSFIYFYGGYPFLQGLYREVQSRLLGMMTLIGVAITVAYVYSSATVFGLAGTPFFWELATLIDIMLLGHWMEMKSILGASKALEELVRLMPSVAHKIVKADEQHKTRRQDGDVIDISPDQLSAGDRVLIKPGEKIPADGVVLSGASSVDEALLTGESGPVRRITGSEVIGGSVNGEGSLTVEVKKTGKESFLSQVIELVHKAQESKSRAQDVSNRVAFWLTIIALSAGALTFFVWATILDQSISFSLERAVTVMVITCPHALGLAVPLVIAVSTSIAATNGLLIRNRVAFENARNINAVIFDKTGTLTEGRFGVTDVVSSESTAEPGLKLNNEEVLRYSVAVENFSEHPIAKAIIVENEKMTDKDRFKVEDFKNITGEGAQAVVDGKDVKIVSPAYLKKHAIEFPDSGTVSMVENLTEQGKTVVILLLENRVAGAIALADIVRAESKRAIEELKKLGVESIMMTGDNERVARWVSEEIGLDDYFAEVLPQQKADKVKEVQRKGLIVAMTGDGVNDAPALAQADIGVAIGSGTDVAIETADIVLVRSNPQDIVNIIKLARSTYSKMVQNLAWATGYNILAIPIAAGVLYGYGVILNPAVGAGLMSLSTIIVAINAKLLRL